MRVRTHYAWSFALGARAALPWCEGRLVHFHALETGVDSGLPGGDPG